jgi:hypothetical protein
MALWEAQGLTPSQPMPCTGITRPAGVLRLAAAPSLLAGKYAIEEIAKALDVPAATIKNMAFKQKALLSMDPKEARAKVEKVAEIVEVGGEPSVCACARARVTCRGAAVAERSPQAKA